MDHSRCEQGRTSGFQIDVHLHKSSLPTQNGAVCFAGAIYVAESRLGSYSESALKFDPSQNRWDRLPSQELAASYAALVASKGYIYSIGGDVEGDGL